MRRHHLALLGLTAIVTVFVARVWAQPAGKRTDDFQGYWMGVDPLDGGDSRRSLIRTDTGKFALAGRDTVLSLCDGTDRGLASFDDGEVVARNVMQTNALILRCFNNGASVVLHARYELVADALMIEILTRPDGSPVTTIVFHKVSQK